MPTIAIVAPSGYAPEPANVTRAIERLQERGWRVKNFVDPADKFQRFAADDATRLAQLYLAVDDAEVDVIMAMRGGYGISRIVEQIDFARLAASGKLFVGFSDFTPIHLGLLAKAGKISFAGPMICEDLGTPDCHEFSFRSLKDCLLPTSTDDYMLTFPMQGNPVLQVEGTFWGGNLAMVAHLVGSDFMPTIEGGILFLEDVNEMPNRVERMLLQLHHAGILARQKALLLGQFTNYRLTDYENGYDFNAMLEFIRSRISIPIITGLPFGHCANKVTLPIGARVTLTSNANETTLQFGTYPHLAGSLDKRDDCLDFANK